MDDITVQFMEGFIEVHEVLIIGQHSRRRLIPVRLIDGLIETEISGGGFNFI